jgi:hypothetical protein
MNEQFHESVLNHEKMQESIEELQALAEGLVDQEFQRELKANEHQVDMLKLSPEELEKYHRYDSSFRLPELEGQQGLRISLRSKNPNNIEDPRVITRINHDVRNPQINDFHTQYFYEIVQSPDGDLFLESGVRDLTHSGRARRALNKAANGGLAPSELAKLSVDFAHRGLKMLSEAKAGRLEEKQLGLHNTSQIDIDHLKDLMSQAKPFTN